MMLLAKPAGRLLERMGNHAPRGMIVHDRTRLIGRLRRFPWLRQGNLEVDFATSGPAPGTRIPAPVEVPPKGPVFGTHFDPVGLA